jgi:hypothetical protein
MATSQKTDGKQTVKGKFPTGNKNGKKFPKGVSGNPNGRPRLTRLTESLRRLIAETNPHAHEETIAETIAQTLVTMALAGDIAAIKEIADRTEGKPKQSLDLDVSVQDWRTEAQKYGLSERDVLDEARLLIAESDIDSSDEATD